MATVTTPPAAIPKPQRPNISAQQKQLIVSATRELIHATVLNRPATYPDPNLDGAASLALSGAFVSLKRGKHLRACCGGLQDVPVALGKAVADAALRTTLDDVRFPPVSPVELEHLQMEIWLLFNPQPVRAKGEERVEAVTVGRHGLVVSRGDSRGLLLPGVATDHGWEARRFLEQVCVKAGLHPSLWKDDGTALVTFEGDALRGRLHDGGKPITRPQPAEPLPREDLAKYVAFCLGNLSALLSGALPSFYLHGVADQTVSGVALSVRSKDGSASFDLSKVSLRPGVPLQTTLYELTQGAAQTLAAQGLTAADLDALNLGLTLLVDPALHGTVADPDLAGVSAGRRAVLVLERQRAGIVFQPERAAEELLAEAVKQARIHAPASAGVFSFQAVSTEPSVVLSTAPRPQPGPAVRPPGVAGRFYPADPAELEKLVDRLLGDKVPAASWSAAMVPHAGLVYSGRIAAAVLKRIQVPRTVIVLGPKHTPLGMEWAVAPHESWALPGGTVASDPELARRLADAIPGLALDAAAHQQEHGIEVELPFLARLAPESRVVGIAIGHGDLASCRRFADGLAKVVRACDPAPLLLISSDMNHFATDAETRQLDELALTALERLDPEDVYETVTGNHISMCGVLPAVIVLETLRRLGRLERAVRVGYGTTADVSGDPSRVVGYAGMLFG